MKKNIKTIIGIGIGILIGISTTVGAETVLNSKDVSYSSDKTSKTNVKDSLDELYGKVGKCPDGQYCYTEPIGLSDKVELGDYISMTPTSTSYTLPNELSGCDGTKDTCIQNTIDPSELNLWRVIRKNDDGTVDVVSEYVSSKTVSLYGQTAYMNYVGALNTIAAQYTNEKYVQSTRYVGYDNQIEYCTSLENCPEEYDYTKDKDLLESLNILSGRTLDGEVVSYWFSSRIWQDGWLTSRAWRVGLWVTGSNGFYDFNTERARSTSWSVRPIVILKSDVQIKSGDGKSEETAYQLN